MNLRNVGDSKFTAHHTILVEMCLHLKPTRFSGWVVHNDIRAYIEECGEPIFLRDVVSELREDDSTITFRG